MSITVHPITVDQDTQKPDYTAQDYRRSVNSLLFPSNGSRFNSLNCVSAASPTHVLTNTGSVVTVVPHSGFMSPFAGEAAYTYTITDVDGENSMTMTAATGHYKIAVVVTDPSAGQGSTPGAALAAYSSSTADSAIPGIVLGEYNNGAVTDTAVRWQNQGVLIASTLTQLNTMTAVNGQQARVNGVEYERKNGQWVPVTQAETLAFKLPYASQTITLVRQAFMVIATGQITMNRDISSLTNQLSTVYLPEGWRPTSGSYILGTANNGQLISYGVNEGGRVNTTTSGAATGYIFTLTGSWVIP